MTSADPAGSTGSVSRRRVLRMAAAALASLCLLLAACVPPQGVVFPKLDGEGAEITLPGGVSSTPTPPVGSVTLRVLAPAGQEALDAVAALRTGIASGVLVHEEGAARGDLGATIPLEELTRFAGPLTVVRVDPPTSGTLEDALLEMEAAGTLPDVFLADALPRLYAAGGLAPLDVDPTVRAFLREGVLLPPALEACVVGGRLLGLPHSATTQVLCFNRALLQEAGIETAEVEAGLTFESFSSMLPRLTDAAERRFALYDAAPFLALLPATRDAGQGWATYSGGRFRFASTAFTDAVVAMRSVVKGPYALNHLTADQISKFYGTTDPRATGKVAFWIAASDRVDEWTGFTGLSIGIAPLPFIDRPVLPLSVRSLCVNPASTDLASAMSFAAFLAADPDALRLLSRFGVEAGTIPMSVEPTVWADGAGSALASALLATLRPLLPDAFVEGRLGVPGWSEALAASLDARKTRLLLGLDALSSVASAMDAAAVAALEEASATIPSSAG